MDIPDKLMLIIGVDKRLRNDGDIRTPLYRPKNPSDFATCTNICSIFLRATPGSIFWVCSLTFATCELPIRH